MLVALTYITSITLMYILNHECAIIIIILCIYKYKINYSAVRNNIPT